MEVGTESVSSCLLHLPLPLPHGGESFSLEMAVCNHGFFMMAPNVWIPSTKSLQRPLRLADSTTSVTVTISHPPNHPSLLVWVLGTDVVSSQDRKALLAQVARMLRVSAKYEMEICEFHKIHPKAKKRGFGRLFRSPTLFEDTVKSLLLCYSSWGRTLSMAKALCELQLEFTSKTPIKENATVESRLGYQEFGNFPSSKELVSMDENLLKRRCKLGYRTRHIIELARCVEKSKLQLNKYEEKEEAYDVASYNKVYKKLMKIKGFGPFTCANVLMCMGFYQKIPTDTETIRHLQQIHGRKKCTKRTIGKDVQEIYEKYAPFQCLVYWFELWDFYENKFGKLSELPNTSYRTITGGIESSGRKSRLMK